MPPHLILWSVFLYIGAALLLPRLRARYSSAALRLGMLLAAVAAFLTTLIAILTVGPDRGAWTLAEWSQIAGGGALRFQLDRAGIPWLIAGGLVGIGALLGTLEEDERWSLDTRGGLLVLVAGMTLLALADNVLTMLLALLLLIGGHLFAIGLAGRPRWLLVVVAQTVAAYALLLAAALRLSGGSGGTDLAAAGTTAAGLAIASGVLLMAPLPVSLFPVPFESLPRRLAALIPLTTLGAGALILLRVAQQVATPSFPSLAGLIPIAALGVGLAGWVAWRSPRSAVRLMMIAAGQASWVLWALAAGHPTLAASLGLAGSIALAALALHGGEYRRDPLEQGAGVLAALMLIGVPPGVLGSAMVRLGGEAWRLDDSARVLPAMGVIGLMGATIALADWLFPEQGGTDGSIPRRAATGLLALASVPWFGWFWGLRLPALEVSAGPGGPLLGGLVIPVIGWSAALLLWRSRERLRTLQPFIDFFAEFFSFVWLWRLLGWLGWLILSGVRGMTLVLEGENYGWLLLFLFVTMLFLLQG